MAATPTLPPETVAPPDRPGSVGSPISDRYALGEEIARGGMGVVLAARDTHFNRDVAVKVLRPEYRGRPAAVRRFLDEARVTGQLQHPGVPPAHDLGTLPDGSPFLALKLIKGRTLADLFAGRSDDPAERSRLLAVVEQVAQTLAYAHSNGVLHRDLKPGNVMVGAFGEVQVMDWGLAKLLTTKASRPREGTEDDPHRTAAYDPPSALELPDSDDKTQAGAMLGTPAYMPPEQAAGQLDRIERRADVFALGAVLCELLTGKPPYVGDTSEKTKALAMLGQLQPAYDRLAGCGADAELVGLARRCLAADPGDRPADAQAVADALSAHRAGVEAKLRAAEVSAAEQRVRRRLRARVTATVMLALAVGGAAAGWQWRRAERALDQVTAKEQETAVVLGRETAERERVTAALAREAEARPALLNGLRELFSRTWSDVKLEVVQPGHQVFREFRQVDTNVQSKAAALVRDTGRVWADTVSRMPSGADADRLAGEGVAWTERIMLELRESDPAARTRRAVDLWRSLPATLFDDVRFRRWLSDDLCGYAFDLEAASLTWQGPALPSVADGVEVDWLDVVGFEPSGALGGGLGVALQQKHGSSVYTYLDEVAVGGGALAAWHMLRPNPEDVGRASAAVVGAAAVAALPGQWPPAWAVAQECLSHRLAVAEQTDAYVDLRAVAQSRERVYVLTPDWQGGQIELVSPDQAGERVYHHLRSWQWHSWLADEAINAWVDVTIKPG